MKFAMPMLVTGLAGVTLLAQEAPRQHPIDLKVAAAADKANSTAESRRAFTDGLKLWDDELNRVYAELKKKLKKEAFEALQASQKQWIAHRDAEVKFLAEFYGQFSGTMYQPMHASAVMNVTRARALELSELLDMQKEHGGE